MTGSKEFQNSYSSACHLHSSYSLTKKDNPLALTKFSLVRTSGRVDSLDTALSQRPFENVVEKGENAFPTMFSTHPETYSSLSIAFNLLSANALNLDKSKILSFSKEFINPLPDNKF